MAAAQRRLVGRIGAWSVAAVLVLPGAAQAASVATSGYSPPAGQVQSDVSGQARDPGGGTLPFTGLDVGLMATGGVVLLGFGILLGRAARRRPDESAP